MTVSNYSTTSANNTTINSINIAEGCPPSNINNAIRNELSDLRTFLNDSQWFIVGDRDGACTFTRASTTSVTVASTNVTADYHQHRRVKVVGSNSGTLYGKIASSSFSTNTTINFTFDSGTISSSDSTVDVYVGSPYVNPAIPVIDDNSLGTSTVLPPSQASVKNYIDTEVTAQDLDVSDGSTAIAIDLDSETLGILGGTGLSSSASGNNVTLAIDSTVVTKTGTQTLTNKTLTTPIISSISNSGTLSLPTSSDTLVGRTTTDTLTNKTINASNNTLSNIGNSSLSNSSITVSDGSNTSPVSLGGTITYAAGEGLDVAESSGTITYSGEDATSSNKGIAKFNTASFDVTSGDVTIKTAGVGDTQVASGIASTKIADGSVSNTEFQYINSLSSNAQTQLDGKLTASNNLSDIASASTSRTNLGLGTMAVQNASSVSIQGGSITGLGNPSNNSDAVNKSYVDSLINGQKTRTIVRAGTTGNITISTALVSGQTLDGVTLQNDDKIIVKNQSNQTQNGIYVVSSSPARDPDFDTVDELAGQLCIIKEGTSLADTMFLCTTDSGSIGSANITWSQVFPSSGGTVTQIGLTQSGSEFTIANTPVTSAGNITIDVNRISATKIGANTNISDTEYGYLNGVSSNIQTQLDAKATLGDAIAFAVALGS